MFGEPKGRKLPHQVKAKNVTIYVIVVAILMAVALFSAQLGAGLQSFELVKAPSVPLQVYVLDVGQGDAILVRVDGEHTMLIDAGDAISGGEVAAALDVHGVRELDYVVASHLHADHIGGIPKAIEGRTVHQIYEPEIPDDLVPTNAAYEHYLDAVESSGAAYSTLKAGDSFALGDATVEVLAPGGGESKDLNNTSLVLRVTYEDCTCLFTGDMEENEETWLLEQGIDLRADFLKVAHHGSGSSTSDAFLNAVQPKFAAISCGRDNDYGHPASSTMERLQNSQNVPEIHVTAEEGDLEFLYTHSPVPMQMYGQNPKEETP